MAGLQPAAGWRCLHMGCPCPLPAQGVWLTCDDWAVRGRNGCGVAPARAGRMLELFQSDQSCMQSLANMPVLESAVWQACKRLHCAVTPWRMRTRGQRIARARCRAVRVTSCSHCEVLVFVAFHIARTEGEAWDSRAGGNDGWPVSREQQLLSD